MIGDTCERNGPPILLKCYFDVLMIDYPCEYTDLETGKTPFEPPDDKTNKMACTPSACAQWVAKDPIFLHADSEDWSDLPDAQADLSLRWTHMPFCCISHEAAHFALGFF